MVDKDDDTDLALTKHAILPAIVESFLLLETGKCNGSLIAGDDRFILWVVKGDEDFMCNLFDLPGHWAAHSPCTRCTCSKNEAAPDYFLKFDDLPPWMLKLFASMLAWMAHCRSIGKERNILAKSRSEGGLGLHLLRS